MQGLRPTNPTDDEGRVIDMFVSHLAPIEVFDRRLGGDINRLVLLPSPGPFLHGKLMEELAMARDGSDAMERIAALFDRLYVGLEELGVATGEAYDHLVERREAYLLMERMASGMSEEWWASMPARTPGE